MEMKATGIVRRIDDLGRVVIPKEIRRTMRIREGDPLEIYTDSEGEVIFKKYSPIGELHDFAVQYADTLYKTSGRAVIICDRDTVIACAGVKSRDFADKKTSSDAEKLMDDRKMYVYASGQKAYEASDEKNDVLFMCAMPIISAGDVIGLIGTLANADDTHIPDDTEIKLVQTGAVFLGKQME